MRTFKIIITADNGVTVCEAYKDFSTWTEAENFAIGLKGLFGGKTYSIFYA